MAAQMLRARGARVVLCGRRRVRLDLALRHSADAVVDTREQNVRTELRTHAPDGVDMVVDAGSAPDTALYLDILRERDGQIVLSGFSTDGLMLDMDALQKREITVYTNSGWTRRRLEATLDLVATRVLQATPLITHQFSYRDAPGRLGA